MESILWARIAAWGGALLLTFVLGFVLGSSGGDGVSRDAYEKAVEQRDDAEAELQSLRTRAAANALSGDDQADDPAGDETGTGVVDDNDVALDDESANDESANDESANDDNAKSDDGAAEPEAGERSYVAKEGDTWWAIAQQFYGDGGKYTIILKANGLGDNAFLAPGTSYVIPPADSN